MFFSHGRRGGGGEVTVLLPYKQFFSLEIALTGAFFVEKLLQTISQHLEMVSAKLFYKLQFSVFYVKLCF